MYVPDAAELTPLPTPTTDTALLKIVESLRAKLGKPPVSTTNHPRRAEKKPLPTMKQAHATFHQGESGPGAAAPSLIIPPGGSCSGAAAPSRLIPQAEPPEAQEAEGAEESSAKRIKVTTQEVGTQTDPVGHLPCVTCVHCGKQPDVDDGYGD